LTITSVSAGGIGKGLHIFGRPAGNKPADGRKVNSGKGGLVRSDRTNKKAGTSLTLYGADSLSVDEAANEGAHRKYQRARASE